MCYVCCIDIVLLLYVCVLACYYVIVFLCTIIVLCFVLACCMFVCLCVVCFVVLSYVVLCVFYLSCVSLQCSVCWWYRSMLFTVILCCCSLHVCVCVLLWYILYASWIGLLWYCGGAFLRYVFSWFIIVWLRECVSSCCSLFYCVVLFYCVCFMYYCAMCLTAVSLYLFYLVVLCF